MARYSNHLVIARIKLPFKTFKASTTTMPKKVGDGPRTVMQSAVYFWTFLICAWLCSSVLAAREPLGRLGPSVSYIARQGVPLSLVGSTTLPRIDEGLGLSLSHGASQPVLFLVEETPTVPQIDEGYSAFPYGTNVSWTVSYLEHYDVLPHSRSCSCPLMDSLSKVTTSSVEDDCQPQSIFSWRNHNDTCQWRVRPVNTRRDSVPFVMSRVIRLLLRVTVRLRYVAFSQRVFVVRRYRVYIEGGCRMPSVRNTWCTCHIDVAQQVRWLRRSLLRTLMHKHDWLVGAVAIHPARIDNVLRAQYVSRVTITAKTCSNTLYARYIARAIVTVDRCIRLLKAYHARDLRDWLGKRQTRPVIFRSNDRSKERDLLKERIRLAPSPKKPVGGGPRTLRAKRRVSYSELAAYEVQGAAKAHIPTAVFMYSLHAAPVAVPRLQAEGMLCTKMSLEHLSQYATFKELSAVARIHHIDVPRYAKLAVVLDLLAEHHCPLCDTYVTVFTVLPSKETATTRKKRVGNPAAPTTFTEPESLRDPKHLFPPVPLSTRRQRHIVRRYCKRMAASEFEEGGCAVCGQTVLRKNLSPLRHVKNALHVLEAKGVTVVERRTDKDRHRELKGPVVDKSVSDICRQCRAHVTKGQVPPLALCNGLWLGEVPKELKDLRFMERLLVSRVRHTCAYVKVQSGFKKMKANVVCFESPTPKVYDHLPPPVADMQEVLAIVFTGPLHPTEEDLKRVPILVRHHKVREALEWLRLNHPDYDDVTFSPENLKEYPEDVPPVTVQYFPKTSNKTQEGTSTYDLETEDGVEEGQCPFVVHGLTSESLNSETVNRIKAKALKHFKIDGGAVLAVGHGAEPEALWKNESLYPKMFPWLFPYGKGGMGSVEISNKNMGDTRYKKWLMGYHDRRFQEDTTFPFVAFCHEQIKSSSSASFLMTEKKNFNDITERLMNVDHDVLKSLIERMEEGENVKPQTEAETNCYQVIRDLDAVAKNVKGMPTTKKYMNNEIWSMISHRGAPSWYITFSPCDFKSPIALQYAGEKIDLDNMPAFTDGDRLRIIARNPAAAAKFFHFMVTVFVEEILGCTADGKPRETGLYGDTSGYYGTVEQQGRLTLHLHLMVWIQSALSPQEIRDRIVGEDSVFQKKLIDWLESCHTGDFFYGPQQEVWARTVFKESKAKDEATKAGKAHNTINHTYDPTYTMPVPPPDECDSECGTCPKCQALGEWEESFKRTVDEILVRSNVHDCERGINKDGTESRKKDHANCRNNKYNQCKARFPRTTRDETVVDEKGALQMKQTEPNINTVTPALSYFTRSNIDVTSLLSGTAIKAVVLYITNYITKTSLTTHVIFDVIREMFSANGEMLSGDASTEQKARQMITKIVNRLAVKLELGSPMICLYLLGNPDHYTDHTFVPFYWKDFVTEALSVFLNEGDDAPSTRVMIRKDKNGNLKAVHSVKDYTYRHEHFNDLSLYDWVVRTKKEIRKKARKGQEDEAASVSDNDDETEGFGSRPLPKHGFPFKEGHGLEDSHYLKEVPYSELSVVNFINPSVLPRKDAGDREYYCATMLALFKPWRTGLDLKEEDQTWHDTFEAHPFSDRQRMIMDNFHLRYECLDQRDDFHAEMKKAGSQAKISSWDPSVSLDNPIELSEDYMQGTDGNEDYKSPEDLLEEAFLAGGYTDARTMAKMLEMRQMLQMAQWTTEVPREPPPMIERPTVDNTSRQWLSEIQRLKTLLTSRRMRNLPSEVTKKRGNNDPFKVEVVTKDHLEKRLHSKEHKALIDEIAEEFHLNAEQNRAFRIVTNHAISPYSEQLKMYIGGMGGTGKSQVLKALIKFFDRRKESHRILIVAPTGSAAALLGGTTYHAAFGVNSRNPLTSASASAVKSRLVGVDYIFFDEVSMLSASDLYKISAQLSRVLDLEEIAFGGLNMILAGDFAQLPPVVAGEQGSLYSTDAGKDVHTKRGQEKALGKALWHTFTTAVILRQNMRQNSQTPEDAKMRTALENLRYAACTTYDMTFLNTLVSSFAPGRKNVAEERFRNVSIITSTNAQKDEINSLGARRFANETSQVLTDFYSDDSLKRSSKGNDEDENKRNKRTLVHLKTIPVGLQRALWEQPPSGTEQKIPGKLSLCRGMPVILRQNLATELCMTNGQEGFVCGWDANIGAHNQNVLETLYVQLKNPPSEVTIPGLPTNVVPIPSVLNRVSVNLPGYSRAWITRKQVEVLVNFSITDYASQGKTRPENVVAMHNCGTHQAIYTCLSRSATAEGTLILQGINPALKRLMTQGASKALRQEFRELELLDEITKLQFNSKLPVSVQGVTRTQLITSFRKHKGATHNPSGLHQALRWNDKQPWITALSIDEHTWHIITSEAKNKPAVAMKRKAPEIQANAKRQKLSHTNHVPRNDVPCPLGLRWSRNSCAYDSFFVILIQLWMQNKPFWDATWGAGNDYTRELVTLLRQHDVNNLALENVRDAMRYRYAADFGEAMRFGRFSSVNNVWIPTLRNANTVLQSSHSCTECGNVSQLVEIKDALIAADYIAGIQNWIDNDGLSSITRRCTVCRGRQEETKKFVNCPALLAFEWNTAHPAPRERIPASFYVTLSANPPVCYELVGLVYFGDNHFTTRIRVGDRWWFHDGIATGRSMILDGGGDFDDFATCRGMRCTASMYTRVEQH